MILQYLKIRFFWDMASCPMVVTEFGGALQNVSNYLLTWHRTVGLASLSALL
jgi:hypothetical protein